MAGLKLFFSHCIPPARSVNMVMKALNLPVTLIEVDIFSSTYKSRDLLKLNPQHTIPTLQDGNFALWDSHAIASYLVDKYSPNSQLYPKDLRKRAIINQRLFLDTEKLFPRLCLAIVPLLLRLKTVIPNGVCSELYKSYDLLNALLKQSKWFADDVMTIADLCCITTISSADYFVPISQKRHPLLHDYVQRFNDLPYYEEANLYGMHLLGAKVQDAVTLSKNAEICYNFN